MSAAAPPDKDAARSQPSSGTTAALTSSPQPAESEAGQLRLELQQCREKFESWKARAKFGVDQMRAQIVDLTQRLAESEDRRQASLATAGDQALPPAYVRESQSLAYAHALAAASLLADTVVAAGTSGTVAGDSSGPVSRGQTSSPTSSDAAVEALQKAMRDQSSRLKEVQHALKRTLNELQQRTEALRLQDEAAASLRRRIAALEATNAALEEQLMRVPNAEEWRQAQEELDHHLHQARLEYEDRESQLVLHHSNELQALNAAHAQELREMQREQSDTVAQAVREALAGQSTGSANEPRGEAVGGREEGARGREVKDAAYVALLDDYKAMESRLAAVTKERDAMTIQQKTLLRELQDLLRSTGDDAPAPAADGAGTSTTATHAAGPAKTATVTVSLTDSVGLEDVARQIGEQRLKLGAIHEELQRTRREVMQLRRAKAAAPVEGLSGQQLQYLRSVVLQLLCSLSEPRVARHLLPVLSILLKFTDDDLKAITRAMPQWKSAH